jgi:predicted transcriptional regulator
MNSLRANIPSPKSLIPSPYSYQITIPLVENLLTVRADGRLPRLIQEKKPFCSVRIFTSVFSIDKLSVSIYIVEGGYYMAVATINLTFDDDLVKQIDLIANTASITRTQLIYNSVKMYIKDKQRLQELYAYGENIAKKNNFTEEDVFEEIRNYRKSK